MPNSIAWVVVMDKMPQIIAGMEDKADQIVRKAALDVEAQAKTRAPVDTGFLRSSIQAVKVGPAHWRVTVQADYGIYLEFGTVNMAPQPYFTPAVEAVRQAFNAAMKGVIA